MSERRSVYDALAQHPEAQERYRDSAEFREAIDAMAVLIEKGSEEFSDDQEYMDFMLNLQAIMQEWR